MHYWEIALVFLRDHWQTALVALAVCMGWDIFKWLWTRSDYCPDCGEHLENKWLGEGWAECCPNCHFYKNYHRSIMLPEEDK